jgi:peroxiredoxin family protein
MPEKNNRLSLIMFSDDMDKALVGFMLAVGAASCGMEASIYFAFWGLNILKKERTKKIAKPLLGKMFGRIMPRGINKLSLSKMDMGGIGRAMMKYVMKKNNISSLSELLATAKELGVRLVACQLSMEVMGITTEELIDGLDYGNVAVYLEDASKSTINLFI